MNSCFLTSSFRKRRLPQRSLTITSEVKKQTSGSYALSFLKARLKSHMSAPTFLKATVTTIRTKQLYPNSNLTNIRSSLPTRATKLKFLASWAPRLRLKNSRYLSPVKFMFGPARLSCPTLVLTLTPLTLTPWLKNGSYPLRTLVSLTTNVVALGNRLMITLKVKG